MPCRAATEQPESRDHCRAPRPGRKIGDEPSAKRTELRRRPGRSRPTRLLPAQRKATLEAMPFRRSAAGYLDTRRNWSALAGAPGRSRKIARCCHLQLSPPRNGWKMMVPMTEGIVSNIVLQIPETAKHLGQIRHRGPQHRQGLASVGSGRRSGQILGEAFPECGGGSPPTPRRSQPPLVAQVDPRNRSMPSHFCLRAEAELETVLAVAGRRQLRSTTNSNRKSSAAQHHASTRLSARPATCKPHCEPPKPPSSVEPA